MDVADNLKSLLKKYSRILKSKEFINNSFYKDYLNQLYPNLKTKEQLYLFEHNMLEPPNCACGNRLRFHKSKNIYRTFCNNKKCTFRVNCAHEKFKSTNLARYGIEIPFTSDDVKEKTKQTNLIKYGVEHPAQNADIMEKTKQTNLIKYGVEHPAQNADIMEKIISTNLIRYGVEHPAQNSDVMEKIISTNLLKYGVDTPFLSLGFKEKRKETMLTRHGVEYALQSPLILAKYKATVMAHHGVNNPLKNKDIYNKYKKTMLAHHGVEHPVLSTKVKQQTLDRYQVEYILQSSEIREKSRQTNLIKYGVEHANQNKLIRDKQRLSYGLSQETIDILDNKEKFTELLNQHGGKKLAIILNISDSNISLYAIKYNIRDGLRSNLERSVREWLNELPYEFRTDRNILYGKEIDFYCAEKQFGIELNGLAYHGENIGHKDKDYHLWKYDECARQSIRLIHLFEDEWYEKTEASKNIILTQLGLTEKGIGARKLNIRTISSRQANEFFETYHIQGKTNSLQVCIGSYEGKNLVGVMGFGHPTRQSTYQYELKRYCTNHKVYPGLASRLFQHFIRHYHPTSIVSFCDKRFFLGKSYTMMGFVNDGDIPPDYQYTDYISRFHKSLFRKAQIEKKFNIDIEGKTEKELMQTLGYDRIWDIGKIRFVWFTSNT